jgi:hypothetical protein
MRQELDDFLFQRYPGIFCDRHNSAGHTGMCWGFECGDGWFDIINELCAEISAHITAGEMPAVVATQVKSKVGSLRFYFYNRASNPLACALVEVAQRCSELTCEQCGAYFADASDWRSGPCPCDAK